MIEVGVFAHGASRRFLTHMSSFPGRAFRHAPLVPAVRCAGQEKSLRSLLLTNRFGVDAVLPADLGGAPGPCAVLGGERSELAGGLVHRLHPDLQ
ncbi:hypothetical protein SBA4_4580020 [Candidatus Sulfopaludibacter sp. SbA4]|nr:hypothetical protein SBA4_4580020 [Candidatus Sulfopaludibacter sp. SbA4]